MTRMITATTLALSLAASPLLAAPSNGWSINAGYADHDSDLTISSESYSSDGLSIGGDYQFAMNNQFSINIFLMTSLEDASGHPNVKGADADHSIIGVQGRYWLDELFVGAHVGSYYEGLDNLPGGGNTSGQGFGFGVAVGWEDISGWYFMGQYDVADEIDTWSNSDVDLTGMRFSVGYRLK